MALVPAQRAADRLAVALGEPAHGRIEIDVASHAAEPAVVRERHVLTVRRTIRLVEHRVHGFRVGRRGRAQGIPATRAVLCRQAPIV